MSTLSPDDALVDRIASEVLRRLAPQPAAGAGVPSRGLAFPTVSSGGRAPLALHDPNTVKPAAGAGQSLAPVLDLGSLDLCTPCHGCQGCSVRRPKTVRAMIESGACRIGSAPGWCPSEPDIASLIDHTVLKPDACAADIDTLCKEAAQYCFATVCVNGVWVRRAADALRGSQVRVCTVVGFPLGASVSEVKAYEATRAIRDGATEIDMVINVGALKSGDLKLVERDIRAVVEACGARILVKVILETALLTRDEKITACRLAKTAGAHYVKTSTGFAKSGATVEDVALMREVVGEELGVKASGGIRDYEAAQMMVDAGATRLGTSASVKIATTARRGARSAA